MLHTDRSPYNYFSVNVRLTFFRVQRLRVFSFAFSVGEDFGGTLIVLQIAGSYSLYEWVTKLTIGQDETKFLFYFLCLAL